MIEATHHRSDALVPFAHGIQDDLSAVKASLTLAWTHRVTAGHAFAVSQPGSEALPGIDAAVVRW